MSDNRKKNVALVLSSGGPRGYAHVGAIKELLARGYRITSIAGTSMGALVGGIFATGHLDEMEEWSRKLTRAEVLRLSDVALSASHIIKGEKVMSALKRLAPDCDIETLPIPYCAIATDLLHSEEIVFRSGSLYGAIRASIAIPTYFAPVRKPGMLLVDGGLTNPLPLNRVERHKGDLLVSVNVSAPNDPAITQARRRLHACRTSAFPPIVKRMVQKRSAINYLTLINRSIGTQIQHNAAMALQLTPPDVSLNMPKNMFEGLDYHDAGRIIDMGQDLMRQTLDAYEKSR